MIFASPSPGRGRIRSRCVTGAGALTSSPQVPTPSPRGVIAVKGKRYRQRIGIGLFLIIGGLWGDPLYGRTLVLVSIDGFRWDYLDRPEAHQMKALADRGVRVTRLMPVYPSKTFPAHLSMATGLYPTQHGIVDNYFCRNDRLDCYQKGAASEDPSWLAGTPLWTLVEQQGGRAATFFWPESEAPIAGTLPSEYRQYDARTPHAKRISQAIQWLEAPANERPQLITLYFSTVDSAGHAHGPDASQTRGAIAEVDRWIATLWRVIDQINAREAADINLMLVSDHGMAAVDRAQFIDTNTLPRPRGFKRVNSSTRVMYYQRGPDADLAALSERLEGMSDGRYRIVTKDVLTNRHYRDHPAVASLIIETDPPRLFRRGGAAGRDLAGMHGYAADEEEMAAFLVAVGPSFATETIIAKAHQLDVYPVAARLLSLTVPAGLASDGGPLQDALRTAERE